MKAKVFRALTRLTLLLSLCIGAAFITDVIPAASALHTTTASSTWAQLYPIHSPLARDGSAMAYDPATHQTVLFGGYNETSETQFGDTWVWNGTDWTEMHPATSPSPRSSSLMAFDAATNQLLLYGGSVPHTSPSASFDDTWVWTGNDWRQMAPASDPPVTAGASMAYDPASQQMILFGGESGTVTLSDLNDTWDWTGATWVQLHPATSPVGRYGAVLSFDVATQQLLLFGGANATSPVPSLFADTWEWTGTTWEQLRPGTSPPSRLGASLDFDAVSGQLMLVGGYGSSGTLTDTWAWTGSTWQQLDPSTSPPNTNAMAYDPSSSELILLDQNSDTWGFGAAPPPVPAACSTTLPSGSVIGMATSAGGTGYWIADRSGQVAACGTAPQIATPITTTASIVGIAAAPSGEGYWLVASNGGVFSFGSARFYGSTGNLVLNQPVVGMASDPATGGYWLVASDGGIFAFNAPFCGSMGGQPLNQPVVGMAADTAFGGAGYWLVASDGGIFSFGGAPFYGSMGGQPLNKPIVGMAADPATGGYWEVASDGGIFSFDATFHGSMGGQRLNQPIVGMSSDPATGGYWEAAADGGIFSFWVPFYGSAA